MKKSLAAILGLAALTSACATSTSTVTCSVPAELVQTAGHRISVGDVIALSVYGEENMDGEYLVSTNGAVSLPLIGTVNAQGLTINEFITELEHQLTEELLNTPRVNAQFIKFRPYYVLGEVENPGSYPYELETDLYAAIASAGGFTYRAQQQCVRLRRKDVETDYVIPVDARVELSPGDVIIVDSRAF